MRITVFGIGYVGLVQAAVLADLGNTVVCLDVDQEKINELKRGNITIYEPGLDALVSENYHAGRLQFATSAAEIVPESEIIFIAVGTPMGKDGAADLTHVMDVAETISKFTSGYTVVVIKSTVPVGTGDRVETMIRESLCQYEADAEFDVVSNPEFLKEGAAVADCTKPDRIVLGTNSDRALKLMSILYAPMNRNHKRTLVMDRRSAELTKYAANCMLATKISFMNEMANLAEKVGADIEMVRNGIGSDPRIGYQFIYPGCGYGGSCFPKDVSALICTANNHGYDPQILRSVGNVNLIQKDKIAEMIQQHYGFELSNKTFAVWGATFKPNTNDIREAPSLVTIEYLISTGATVKLFDPMASHAVMTHFEHNDRLVPKNNAMEVLDDVDGLIICTEWKMFKAPDFFEVKSRMNSPVIFDGRNLYDPEYMDSLGIDYYAIGRGKTVKGNFDDRGH